jgi:hypothetical protein
MIDPTRTIAALIVAVALASFCAVTPASARGGGAANIMGSPGYQRALEESRKRYRESYGEPYVRSPAVHPRKKWHHRGKR